MQASSHCSAANNAPQKMDESQSSISVSLDPNESYCGQATQTRTQVSDSISSGHPTCGDESSTMTSGMFSAKADESSSLNSITALDKMDAPGVATTDRDREGASHSDYDSENGNEGCMRLTEFQGIERHAESLSGRMASSQNPLATPSILSPYARSSYASEAQPVAPSNSVRSVGIDGCVVINTVEHTIGEAVEAACGLHDRPPAHLQKQQQRRPQAEAAAVAPEEVSAASMDLDDGLMKMTGIKGSENGSGGDLHGVGGGDSQQAVLSAATQLGGGPDTPEADGLGDQPYSTPVISTQSDVSFASAGSSGREQNVSIVPQGMLEADMTPTRLVGHPTGGKEEATKTTNSRRFTNSSGRGSAVEPDEATATSTSAIISTHRVTTQHAPTDQAKPHAAKNTDAPVATNAPPVSEPSGLATHAKTQTATQRRERQQTHEPQAQQEQQRPQQQKRLDDPSRFTQPQQQPLQQTQASGVATAAPLTMHNAAVPAHAPHYATDGWLAATNNSCASSNVTAVSPSSPASKIPPTRAQPSNSSMPPPRAQTSAHVKTPTAGTSASLSASPTASSSSTAYSSSSTSASTSSSASSSTSSVSTTAPATFLSSLSSASSPPPPPSSSRAARSPERFALSSLEQHFTPASHSPGNMGLLYATKSTTTTTTTGASPGVPTAAISAPTHTNPSNTLLAHTYTTPTLTSLATTPASAASTSTPPSRAPRPASPRMATTSNAPHSVHPHMQTSSTTQQTPSSPASLPPYLANPYAMLPHAPHAPIVANAPHAPPSTSSMHTANTFTPAFASGAATAFAPPPWFCMNVQDATTTPSLPWVDRTRAFTSNSNLLMGNMHPATTQALFHDSTFATPFASPNGNAMLSGALNVPVHGVSKTNTGMNLDWMSARMSTSSPPPSPTSALACHDELAANGTMQAFGDGTADNFGQDSAGPRTAHAAQNENKRRDSVRGSSGNAGYDPMRRPHTTSTGAAASGGAQPPQQQQPPQRDDKNSLLPHHTPASSHHPPHPQLLTNGNNSHHLLHHHLSPHTNHHNVNTSSTPPAATASTAASATSSAGESRNRNASSAASSTNVTPSVHPTYPSTSLFTQKTNSLNPLDRSDSHTDDVATRAVSAAAPASASTSSTSPSTTPSSSSTAGATRPKRSRSGSPIIHHPHLHHTSSSTSSSQNHQTSQNQHIHDIHPQQLTHHPHPNQQQHNNNNNNINSPSSPPVPCPSPLSSNTTMDPSSMATMMMMMTPNSTMQASESLLATTTQFPPSNQSFHHLSHPLTHHHHHPHHHHQQLHHHQQQQQQQQHPHQQQYLHHQQQHYPLQYHQHQPNAHIQHQQQQQPPPPNRTPYFGYPFTAPSPIASLTPFDPMSMLVQAPNNGSGGGNMMNHLQAQQLNFVTSSSSSPSPSATPSSSRSGVPAATKIATAPSTASYRSTNGERKFKCNIEGCNKSFKRSGHLKRHRLVHLPPSQRERFRCWKTSCNKHYSTKYDLAAHMRMTHGGVELLKCPIRNCSRRFVRHESLEKHLKTYDHAKEASRADANMEDEEDEDLEEWEEYLGDEMSQYHDAPSTTTTNNSSTSTATANTATTTTEDSTVGSQYQYTPQQQRNMHRTHSSSSSSMHGNQRSDVREHNNNDDEDDDVAFQPLTKRATTSSL